MRVRVAVAAVLIGFLSARAEAQTPTGTISGHVVSADGLPLPGVEISLTGPALQGTRTTTTSGTGDYLVPLLPPGDYTLSFEIGDFQTMRELRSVAGAQTAVLNVSMSPARVTESVSVVAQAQPFVDTAQVATSFKQELMSTLPSNRTLDAVVLMAPAVHATGPRGAYTMSGSQSYENVYTLNGAVITENLRGAPFTLYIEDALQETTVSSSGVSAEFGRFEGGVVQAITKSGGNFFSGSFRTSFANDNWRSLTPYDKTQLAKDPTLKLKINDTIPTYEATVGGPVKREKLWFFSALRSQVQKSALTTAITNFPYVRTNDDKRFEGKLTYTYKPGHSLQGSYLKLGQILKNYTGSAVMDVQSLVNQEQPQDLWSLHYTGVISRNFFVEALYSQRHLSFGGAGATTKDLIKGTLILDLKQGGRFWSPTNCAGATCDGDERRNNSDVLLKGTYFMSGKGAGSHQLVFGYDGFNDNIWANTHASGSDFRIRATASFLKDGTIYPQFIPGNGSTSTQIEWDPIQKLSKGSNLRTHSGFINDSWRFNNHLSFSLGLRLDKNQATDGEDQNVGDKASLSPRLSTIWDPKGDGKWSVTGSFARYVMALTSNLAGSTTAAGNSAVFRWFYQGPAINSDATTANPVGTEDALRQLFDWFNANDGTKMTPAFASLPGVSMRMVKPLTSPYAYEYSGGVSRSLGNRGAIRVDGMFRDYKNFYSLRTDLSTGRTADALNNQFDLGVLENTNAVKRRYAGLVTQLAYNIARKLDLGANYTLSHAYGNLEGETVAGGPSGTQLLSYPEYKQASWNAPMGDLLIDQRHRAHLWATYLTSIPRTPGLMTIGLLQQMGSGTPYGALGSINPRNYVTNPGYQIPPTSVDYYFTARDAYHTDATYRTDVSGNYSYRIAHASGPQPELFVHAEVLNVFNQFQLCGCGDTVFKNGGITNLTTIGQTVSVPNAFDPFNAQPVENVNWVKSSTFGHALNAFAYTSPRMFRFSVGVKF
jgi:Carboxypeptidase regulatory-like domain